jgi:hypothetical protein
MQTKIKKRTINYEIIPVCLCGVIFIISLFCITFVLPISEIFIGIYYKNKIICNNSLIINVSDWLIIKGSVYIGSIIIHFICLYSGKNSLLYCITLPIVYVINLFLLTWLIIGSINFWRDCPLLEPKEINTFMWCSLIMGYIFLLNTIAVNNRYLEKKDKDKNNLLG